MKGPWLSVVIPAYNEASRIRITLDELLSYLRSRGRDFEILVADDGSRDGTADVVEKSADPEVRVLRSRLNQGKGAAVRRAVAEARGHLILVTDADHAIPIRELPQFEQWVDRGFAIVCGSRGLAQSRALSRLPVYRQRMGKIFNWLVRGFQLTRFRDTQCGFKLFRADAAREIFSRCRVNRFAYDVESLHLAERLGYRVVEVPIRWRHVPESRVDPVIDAVRMLRDLLRIRLRAWREDLPRRRGDGAPSE